MITRIKKSLKITGVNDLLWKIIRLLPISFRRKIGYSKLGSSIIMYLKKIQKNSRKPYDIGYGLKIYASIFDNREGNLILDKDPEKHIKKIFYDNINEGEVIIDCGANIGEYSLLACKKVGPTGKVIAIEPSQKIIEDLKKNFQLNNFKNFEILDVAVSNKKGFTTLYEHGISELSSLDPNLLEKPTTNKVHIQVETLDDIIFSRGLKMVNLLKIDIDGYEFEAILGCKNSFKDKKIKKILCEVHYRLLNKRKLDENKIYSLLKDNSFAIEFLDNDKVAGVIHILAKIT